MGGSRRTRREPTQTRRQHLNSTQKGPVPAGIEPRTLLMLDEQTWIRTQKILSIHAALYSFFFSFRNMCACLCSAFMCSLISNTATHIKALHSLSTIIPTKACAGWPVDLTDCLLSGLRASLALWCLCAIKRKSDDELSSLRADLIYIRSPYLYPSNSPSTSTAKKEEEN